MKYMNWIIDRFTEPSSYAAAGAIVIGIGMLTEQNQRILLGIVGSAGNCKCGVDG